MVIQRRIGAFCVIAQIGVGAGAVGLLLEFGNIFGVVLHHHRHVRTIERRSFHLFHFLLLGLLLGIDVLRNSQIIFRGNALKVLLGLGVVIDHTLAKFLHVVALSVLGGQLSHCYFGHVALCRLLQKHGIGGVARFGRFGLAGVICGLRE